MYNHKEIEKKWQQKWEESGINKTGDDEGKEKYYCLDMFPYPSGAGLHIGHVESYTATDIMSRYQRMNGKNVLHPQGWDAFGLPAENFAIKTGTHPSITTTDNIKNFTRQIKSLGMSYDWSKEINTSTPEYYKWTQWFFSLLYKNGLAYKKKSKVNWCSKCQTVLANEQANGGICERCSTKVEQRDLEQWFFKITDFIEQNGQTTGLLDGLNKVDWPESIKAAQRNWIGRSEGALVKFPIIDSQEYLEVFTTRVDTIFGCTYCVVAPEHSLIENLKLQIENFNEVEQYIADAKNKTDLDRMEAKEKTGVELKGIKVVNPFNGEAVPLFVADYVLGSYGTGAVMAVPAHDERDFEFAKKYDLEIRKSIDSSKSYVVTIKKSLDNEFYNEVKKFAQVIEVNGLLRVYSEQIDKVFDIAEKYFIGGPWYIHSEGLVKKILFHSDVNKRFDYVDESENKKAYEHGKSLGIKEEQLDWNGAYEATTDDGVLINSGEFTGLKSAEAREKMMTWLEEKGAGARKINYRLRDWLVSRQRYWGAPIPVIYCDDCGEVLDANLPVELPTDVDFKPTGESPLVYSKTFHDVKCPKCGKIARRESDTMDTFVCSSWYYFRYTDHENTEEFASKENIKKWLPVDLYVGGAEHAVLHLLYARFFTKVLHNLGYIDFDEPFLKLRNQGMILAEDGRKMSKSLGNVVNPDEVVESHGADSLRMFEMFMGPLEDAKPWNMKGIVGIRRFLDKVDDYFNFYVDVKTKHPHGTFGGARKKNILHKTIKKIGEDIENFRFNTAIAQLMILFNELKDESTFAFFDELYEMDNILIILSPFAPHLTEELWEKLGHTESIFKSRWPKYNPELIKDESIKLVVQINGKLRDTIEVSADIAEEDAKKIALESDVIKKWIEGKEILKVVVVKGKLVNIVIR